MSKFNFACPCGTNLNYAECCQPFHKGAKAATAEQLMRTRYCAYVMQEIDYLIATTHVSTRKHHNKKELQNWSKNNDWLKLEILQCSEFEVEFKATYKNPSGDIEIHHERSTFLNENDSWYFVDGMFFDTH